MARARIIPVFVPNWGCPNDCVFCDQKRISGSPLPAFGADVARTLETARAEGKTGLELAFYGGSFTAVSPALQEDLLAAAQPFLADGTVTAIRLSTRPDAVDPDKLEMLKRYGVATVELGAQSMDDAVLTASGRGHAAADTVRAAQLVKAAGLRLILQMMTGLPGSCRAKDVRTAEMLADLAPDGVRIYPTVIVRNTPLEDMWRAGTYREHTVADAVAVCADIVPLFEEKGIPVIRLGLNPTDALTAGDAVAGAYHPALGEMVRSEILRRRAAALLKDVPAGSRVTLAVAPQRVSAMIGQHRSNIAALQAAFSLAGIAVKPTETEGDRVSLVDVEQ